MAKKDRKAAREKRRGSKELLSFEAAAGSKSKLADKLQAARPDEYKTKSSARRAIDKAEKAGHLSNADRAALRTTAGRANRQTSQRYAEEVKAPRVGRAKTTTLRNEAKRRAIQSLTDVSLSDTQRSQLEKARKTAKIVHDIDDGIVQYGKDRKYADYVRVIGIVRGDSPKPGQSYDSTSAMTKIYMVPLKEYVAIPHENRVKVHETIPGIEEMSAKERAAAIAEQFSDLTGGRGTLRAFEYVTKEELSAEQKGSKKNRKK